MCYNDNTKQLSVSVTLNKIYRKCRKGKGNNKIYGL